jgi:anti-sigma factor RsiW
VSPECRTLRPLIGAHVLGALEPDEAALVRAHVASCPACAAEHARLAPLPGLLTLAAGAEAVAMDPPPPALEERLLDAVAHADRGRSRVRRRLPLPRLALLGAGAGALAAAAVTLALVLSAGPGPAAPAHGYPVAFRAAAAAPAASGRAELEPVDGGTTVYLWVKGLPADRGALYEVHCDAPGWSASAGTFRVDAHGRAYVVLTTAARRGEYDAIRVLRRTARGGRLVLTASVA